MRLFFAANVNKEKNTGTADTVLTIGKEIEKLGNTITYLFSDDLPITTKRHAWSYLYYGPYLIYTLIKNRFKGIQYDVLMISGGEGYLIPFFRYLIGKNFIYVNRSHGPEVGEDNVAENISIKARLARFVRLLEYNSATKYCDLNIVSTSNEKASIVPYYKISSDKVSVVPLGISSDFLQKKIKINLNNNEIKLLYVGSWIERKGTIYLIQAFKKLIKSYPNLNLTIVGSKNNNEIINEFGINNNLNIYPVLEREKLIQIYDDHEIFILPTLSEGFGKVVLEAMSRGLCVISTRTGFGGEIIKNGVNGYIVPFKNSDAIVEIIKYLHSNPDKVNAISQNAINSVQMFTWKNSAKLTIEKCQKLLEMKRKY